MNNDFTMSLLSDIDNSSLDSELYVIESFMEMYDKYSMLHDNSKSYDVFTESAKKKEESIGSQLKAASKKDSNKFVTAIAFIPRLIGILAKAIKTKLSNSFLGDLNSYFKECKSDKEKRERVKMLNEEMAKYGKDYEFYYDEASGKIRLKKSGKRILILLGWLQALILTTYALYKKLTKIKKGDDDGMARLKNDFKKLLSKAQNGEKKVDPHDMIEDSVDAISSAYGTIMATGAELLTISAGVHGFFDYKAAKALTKDDPKKAEEKGAFYRDFADTASYLTKIVAIITATIGSLGVITKWGEIVKDTSVRIREKKDLDALIKDRAIKKGVDLSRMTSGEIDRFYDNEGKAYLDDVEKATKEILADKGKKDTPENRDKYVSQGDIEDKIEEYLAAEKAKKTK